jgi:thioredoxin 1
METDFLKSDIPVMLDFWSFKCPACEQANVFLLKLEEAYKDKIKIIKVNVEQEFELTKRFMIGSIPTFIFFKNEQIQSRIIGFKGQAVLEKEIRKIIS